MAWATPGKDSDATAWSLDVGSGKWQEPGAARALHGLQYDMPPTWAPNPEQGGHHLMVSPPGTAAPRYAINYTPGTKEVHGIGAQAPVDEMNLSLVPGGTPGGGQVVPPAGGGDMGVIAPMPPATGAPPMGAPDQQIMQLLQAIAPMGGGVGTGQAVGIGEGEVPENFFALPSEIQSQLLALGKTSVWWTTASPAERAAILQQLTANPPMSPPDQPISGPQGSPVGAPPPRTATPTATPSPTPMPSAQSIVDVPSPTQAAPGATQNISFEPPNPLGINALAQPPQGGTGSRDALPDGGQGAATPSNRPQTVADIVAALNQSGITGDTKITAANLTRMPDGSLGYLDVEKGLVGIPHTEGQGDVLFPQTTGHTETFGGVGYNVVRDNKGNVISTTPIQAGNNTNQPNPLQPDAYGKMYEWDPKQQKWVENPTFHGAAPPIEEDRWGQQFYRVPDPQAQDGFRRVDFGPPSPNQHQLIQTPGGGYDVATTTPSGNLSFGHQGPQPTWFDNGADSSIDTVTMDASGNPTLKNLRPPVKNYGTITDPFGRASAFDPRTAETKPLFPGMAAPASFQQSNGQLFALDPETRQASPVGGMPSQPYMVGNTMWIPDGFKVGYDQSLARFGVKPFNTPTSGGDQPPPIIPMPFGTGQDDGEDPSGGAGPWSAGDSGMPSPSGMSPTPPVGPPVPPQSVVGTGNKFGQPVSMEGIHKGTDLQAYKGTPALATVSGVVVAIDNKPDGLGLQVKVRDSTTGEVHTSSHLLDFNVKVGQHVKQGDVIGRVGESGAGATGPHIDFRRQTPDGQYKNPEPDLGPLAKMPMAPNTVGAGQDAPWSRNPWLGTGQEADPYSDFEPGGSANGGPMDTGGNTFTDFGGAPMGGSNPSWPSETPPSFSDGSVPNIYAPSVQPDKAVTPAPPGMASLMGGQQTGAAPGGTSTIGSNNGNFAGALYGGAGTGTGTFGGTTGGLNPTTPQNPTGGNPTGAKPTTSGATPDISPLDQANLQLAQQGIAQQMQQMTLNHQEQMAALQNQLAIAQQQLSQNATQFSSQMDYQKAKDKLDEQYRQSALTLQKQQEQDYVGLQNQAAQIQLQTQGTFQQRYQQQVEQQSLQNPWLTALGGMAPAFGQAGGPGWTPPSTVQGAANWLAPTPAFTGVQSAVTGANPTPTANLNTAAGGLPPTSTGGETFNPIPSGGGATSGAPSGAGGMQVMPGAGSGAVASAPAPTDPNSPGALASGGSTPWWLNPNASTFGQNAPSGTQFPATSGAPVAGSVNPIQGQQAPQQQPPPVDQGMLPPNAGQQGGQQPAGGGQVGAYDSGGRPLYFRPGIGWSYSLPGTPLAPTQAPNTSAMGGSYNTANSQYAPNVTPEVYQHGTADQGYLSGPNGEVYNNHLTMVPGYENAIPVPQWLAGNFPGRPVINADGSISYPNGAPGMGQDAPGPWSRSVGVGADSKNPWDMIRDPWMQEFQQRFAEELKNHGNSPLMRKLLQERPDLAAQLFGAQNSPNLNRFQGHGGTGDFGTEDWSRVDNVTHPRTGVGPDQGWSPESPYLGPGAEGGTDLSNHGAYLWDERNQHLNGLPTQLKELNLGPLAEGQRSWLGRAGEIVGHADPARLARDFASRANFGPISPDTIPGWWSAVSGARPSANIPSLQQLFGGGGGQPLTGTGQDTSLADPYGSLDSGMLGGLSGGSSSGTSDPYLSFSTNDPGTPTPIGSGLGDAGGLSMSPVGSAPGGTSMSAGPWSTDTSGNGAWSDPLLGTQQNAAPTSSTGGLPDWNTFQNWSPFQRAAFRTQLEQQGVPWATVANQLRGQWGSSGGPTQAPNTTQLSYGTMDPLAQIGLSQVSDTFGVPMSQYLAGQQRTWQRGNQAQVQVAA